MKINFAVCLLTALASLIVFSGPSALAADKEGAFVLVVMDPLSAPLSCDCVKGYAQRKYEVLGAYLQLKLKRPVKVFWAQSLPKALETETDGKADLIIGKHSVVLHAAKESKLKVEPVAALTGADGKTTQTGLVVVRANDAAQSVDDLAGYRIFFGPEDCDEKWAAPRAFLKAHGVDVAKLTEKHDACSEAAIALVGLEADAKAAAVISSYAGPLLEGCGSVKKGDLRVIGTTKEVPFITAFVNETLSGEDVAAVSAALLKVGEDADLLIALETDSGFVPFEETEKQTAAAVPADEKKKKN
ncbi:MAG: PhnD/SsuA/transferrin family substrate-binding protein [Planctomycetaceae bacterium]